MEDSVGMPGRRRSAVRVGTVAAQADRVLHSPMPRLTYMPSSNSSAARRTMRSRVSSICDAAELPPCSVTRSIRFS